MAFLFRIAVDRVKAFIHLRQKFGNLLRRILEVIIHCDDHIHPRLPDPAQKRIMLAVVPHKAERPNPCVLSRKLLHHGRTCITTVIVDQDQLVIRGNCRQHGGEPFHK